jgi:hypothetical protein
MKIVLAIARIEFLTKWKLMLIPLIADAAVLALIARGAGFERSTMAAFLNTLVFPLAAVPALMLGMNLFGPEIRHTRLSFFMTRPCSPLQLWLGRLLGAALIIAFGWVGIPLTRSFSGLFPDGGMMTHLLRSLPFAFWLDGILLMANAMAMIIAANATAWFVIDVVVAVALIAQMTHNYLLVFPVRGLPIFVFDPRVLPLLPPALFLAGLAYLHFGHGDGRLGHRAHSLVLWAFAALALVGVSAYPIQGARRPMATRLSPPNPISANPEGQQRKVLLTSGLAS